jgi:hypothetical protein
MRVAPDETVCVQDLEVHAPHRVPEQTQRTGPHSRLTADPTGQSYIDSGTLPQLERAIAPESLPAGTRRPCRGVQLR